MDATISISNDELNESTNSYEMTTDDSRVITYQVSRRETRTINLDDEQIEVSATTLCLSTTPSQDESTDSVSDIEHCTRELCIRQAGLQKAQIDLLEQTKFKEKTEFNEEKAKLEKELEMYKEKNMVLEEELRIVREHQQASDNSNRESRSQDDEDLISKSAILKKLEIFTCCICDELLIKPVVTNCNHSFCKECLDTWRTAKKEECPICWAIIRKVHMTPEIDEYITSMVSCLSDEAFAQRLQIIEDRNNAHLPVKKRKVSSRQDLERYERDDLLNAPSSSRNNLPKARPLSPFSRFEEWRTKNFNSRYERGDLPYASSSSRNNLPNAPPLSPFSCSSFNLEDFLFS